MYRTIKDFNRAVEIIEQFLMHMYKDAEYAFADKDNTYKEAKAFFDKTNGTFLIPLKGNDNTMYSSAELNVLARCWHDSLHFKHNLEFTLEGETKVAELQRDQLIEWAKSKYDCKDIMNAGSLIYLDVTAQYAYYLRYKRFVPHQREFMLNEFLNNY